LSHLACCVVLATPVKIFDTLGKSLEIWDNELIAECPRYKDDVWRYHAVIKSMKK
jgi:hypothetical protein